MHITILLVNYCCIETQDRLIVRFDRSCMKNLDIQQDWLHNV